MTPLRGFSEQQQAFEAGPAAAAQQAQPVGKLTLGTGGRLVVPVEVRTALGLKEGDTLVASLVDGELRLVPMNAAVQRAQAFVRQTLGAQRESVVDEFLREKRLEQMREDLT